MSKATLDGQGYYKDPFYITPVQPLTIDWKTAPLVPRTGQKDTAGKSPVHLIPPRFVQILSLSSAGFFPANALLAIANVLEYGARQAPRPDGTKGYGENNWQDVEGWQHKYYAAALRHGLRAAIEDRDESGHLHLAHMATCLMFLAYKHESEVMEYEQEDGSVTDLVVLLGDISHAYETGNAGEFGACFVAAVDLLEAAIIEQAA